MVRQFTLAVLGMIMLAASAHAVAPTSSATAASQSARLGGALPGFRRADYLGEQIREYRIEPGVNILVNAPAAEQYDPRKPTRLVFFALPNGNTTAQTIGRKLTPGLDWHYDIQHIGAQTRRLRELVQDENIVVAYLEADGKSWPSWRSKHPELYGKTNWQVIASVRELFKDTRTVVELSGHSGGGSFVFGCINGEKHIPPEVRRISFLDSNYNYTDADHGDKLVEWLKGGTDRCLSVVCYDDRNVALDGKPIVSATGGTYRRSMEMVERLKRDFTIADVSAGDLLHYRWLNGRIDIILHKNPQNKILHTVLVGPMSGFIHAMAVGTAYEDKAGDFAGPVTYERFIQP